MNILQIFIFLLIFSIISKKSEQFTNSNCDTKRQILSMVQSMFDYKLLVEPQPNLFDDEDKDYVKEQLSNGKKGQEIATNLVCPRDPQ